MPGLVCHAAIQGTCPHGGTLLAAAGNPRVLLSGQPALTIAEPVTVVGCAFNVSGAAQPCLTVRWTMPATRVTINGVPVVLNASMGLCIGPTQAPQGPAIVVSVQPRVTAM